MKDRNLNDYYELRLEAQAGYQFIQLARALSPILAKAPHQKNAHMKDKLKALNEALKGVGDEWVANAKNRPKYSIPEGRKKEYMYAQGQYNFIRTNKDEYIKKEINKQEELRIIERDLAEEINAKKIELARMEDDFRHQVTEMKHKKETRNNGCLSRHKKKKQEEPAQSVEQVKQRASAEVRRRRKFLTMLRDYRWYIKNQIEQPIDNFHDQHQRWKKAVESYDLNMRINQRYLANAAYRHYANEPEAVISKLFYIYYLIKEIDSIVTEKSEYLQKILNEIEEKADVIYLEKAGDRTIHAFWKYLIMNYDADAQVRLMQVVYKESRLPQIFMASFEDRNSPLNQLLSNPLLTKTLELKGNDIDNSNKKINA